MTIITQIQLNYIHYHGICSIHIILLKYVTVSVKKALVVKMEMDQIEIFPPYNKDDHREQCDASFNGEEQFIQKKNLFRQLELSTSIFQKSCD